jgi:hypothetical protein
MIIKKYQFSEDDFSFFSQYSDFCKLTSHGILYKYPEIERYYPILPLIKNQKIDLENFEYIGFQNTRKLGTKDAINKTVGFFIGDHKFKSISYFPWKYVDRLKRYKQVMSPDFSCYLDMPLCNQWHNVYLNRIVGTYWQHCGLKVIPTISWSNSNSFSFCFKGIEAKSVVAVSTIGTRTVHNLFMEGFRELCQTIKPEIVICYCKPYYEMEKYANIFLVEHEGSQAKKIAYQKELLKNSGRLFKFFDNI